MESTAKKPFELAEEGVSKFVGGGASMVGSAINRVRRQVYGLDDIGIFDHGWY